MARMTAADAAVAILRAEGVTHAFGVSAPARDRGRGLTGRDICLGGS